MTGTGMSLATIMLGFGMSFTFLLCFCIRLLVCGHIRTTDATSSAGLRFSLRSNPEQEHVINGLESVAVASIPMVEYQRQALPSRHDDTQCTICLEDYQEKDMLRMMPICGHNFHLACIDAWLQIQPTCPVCRLPLNSKLKHAAPSVLRVSRAVESRNSS